MSKLDLSSTALEKGIDTAKEFLGKLILPSIEETGLLLRDQVSIWRFKNQVKILTKAKKYCEKHSIKTQSISLKLLCPLLESASLEDDEELQDKWSILLGNLADSEQNIENHVFPFILSQVSKQEFKTIATHVISRTKMIEEMKGKLDGLTESEKTNSEHKVRITENSPMFLERGSVELKNLANLSRLGLIRARSFASADAQSIFLDRNDDHISINKDNFSIDIIDDAYEITELGKLFVISCTEKQSL